MFKSELRDSWYCGRHFFVAHVVWPGMILVAMLLLAENSRLDVLVAESWYRLEGGQWAWRDSWYANNLIHFYGKRMLFAFGLVLIALLFLGRFSARLRRWRKTLAYVLACLAVLPALVALLKYFSQVPCPWDLVRFGGEQPYEHTASYALGHTDTGNCFPAGHASGGFALLSIYFASLGHARRPFVWLLPGLLVGWIFALGQQSRGAHFLSHDLWTLSICWFGALLIFLWIRPDRAAVAPHESGLSGTKFEGRYS